MSKIDKYLIKYVIWSLPAVVILLIWGSIGDPDVLSGSEGITRFFWDTLGWVFMIWVVISFYLTLKTVFSQKFRDHFLSKIARIKERDEREEVISGHAAKFAFLSTLAMLLFFLFLSIFTFTIGKYPEELTKKDDKRGYISLGMEFKPYDLEKAKEESVGKDGKIIVNYSDLPLTKAGLLLFLILWQIGCYHYIARRELRS